MSASPTRRIAALVLAAAFLFGGAGAAALAQGSSHQGHGRHGAQAPTAGPQQMHQWMMQGGQTGQAGSAPQTPAPRRQDHGADRPGVAAAAAQSPAVAAFLAINERMHSEMAVEFTGDVDRDFAAAMIPHHQGAIDMARVVLDQGGRDPEIRQLAEEVIRTQEAEIAQLRAFLARSR
jgi:uncharacterized protein (DUF305 family)